MTKLSHLSSHRSLCQILCIDIHWSSTRHIFRFLLFSSFQTGGLRVQVALWRNNSAICHIWASSWENRNFAYAKTKTQISFAVTAKLISAFVFAARILQSLYFLNLKFQASSHLLWLYSLVCIVPSRKARIPVFSKRGSYQGFENWGQYPHYSHRWDRGGGSSSVVTNDWFIITKEINGGQTSLQFHIDMRISPYY